MTTKYASQQGMVVRPPPAIVAQPRESPGSSGRVILAQALSSEEEHYVIPVAAYAEPTYVQGIPASHHQNSLVGKLERYAHLERFLISVGDATSARANGEKALQAAQKAYNENEQQLKKNRDSQPRAERRLHRNAHPRFLHYLQFNREEKVKRLERELEALRDDERKREEMKKVLGADVEKRKQELAALQNRESEMNGAATEHRQIFDTVVESQPATPNLTSLRYQLQAGENDHRAETALLRQVENSPEGA